MTVRGRTLPPWVLDRLPSMLGAVCVGLLSLLIWVAQGWVARVEALEATVQARGEAIARVEATLTAVDARTARIEATIDARLPVPRLDVSLPR